MAVELTIEQKRALALARARARAAAASQTPSQAADAPVTGGSASAAALAAPEASPAFQRAGGYGPFAAGVADAGIKGFMGVKSLITDLSDEDKAVLRELRQEAKDDPNGFKRGAGEVVANIAATAVPGAKAAGAVGKVTSMLPRALQWLAPATTAATVSGGQGMLLNPSEAQGSERIMDKLRMAGTDAATGAAFAAGGQVLRKALTKPFTPTKEAEDLMAMNITPTLQQGAEGRVGKFVGGLTSAIRDPRQRQNSEVVQEFLRRTMPNVDTSDMTVPETVALLKRNFQGDKAANVLGEYGDLLVGKKFTIDPNTRSALWKTARGAKGMQPQAKQMANEAMAGTGTALNSTNRVRMNYEKLTEYRKLINDQIKELSGDDTMSTQARNAMIKVKNQFDQLVRNPSLSPDELTRLLDIDSRYVNAKRFIEAAGYPGAHTQMKASDLLRSFANAPQTKAGFAEAANPTQRELLEPAIRVMGLTPTQNEARAGLTMGKRILQGATAAATGGAAVTNPMFAAFALPMYAASVAGQFKPGARALMGDYEAQKKLADIMRRAAPYAAGIGQSVTPEE